MIIDYTQRKLKSRSESELTVNVHKNEDLQLDYVVYCT